jgi:hypothetical protein
MPNSSRVDVLVVLAHEFLGSPYASEEFVNWSIDRRVERFLRSRGMTRAADDGDALQILVDRVMDCHNGAVRPH